MNELKFEDLHNIKTASDLLLHIYGEEIENIELPIDVENIIRSLEKVTYSDQASFDDWDKSGFIKVERAPDDKLRSIRIWTNPSEVIERQRFTMSHELGHLFYDVLPQIDDSSKAEVIVDRFERSGNSSIKETRANKFAAQLLMPAKLVKLQINKLVEQVEKQGGTITLQKAIEMLAVKFQVSSLAMEIRLKALGYIK
jgi:hypothetical protein